MKVILILLLAAPMFAEGSKMCKVHPEYCVQQVKELSPAEIQALATAKQKQDAANKTAKAANDAEVATFHRLLEDHGLGEFPMAPYGSVFYNNGWNYGPCGGSIDISSGKYLVYTPFPDNPDCPDPEPTKKHK